MEDNPPPLKLVFITSKEALNVLKKKHKIKHPSARTASDSTRIQREYLKALRLELNLRRGDGESNLTITYV